MIEGRLVSVYKLVAYCQRGKNGGPEFAGKNQISETILLDLGNCDHFRIEVR